MGGIEAGVATPGPGVGGVTQEASAKAASTQPMRNGRCNGAAMEWIILEALVALALGLGIVWWTFSPSRKAEREEERAKSNAEQDRGGDAGDGDA